MATVDLQSTSWDENRSSTVTTPVDISVVMPCLNEADSVESVSARRSKASGAAVSAARSLSAITDRLAVSLS
jgi:hypothetical protein